MMRISTAAALFMCVALNAGYALAADSMSKDKDGAMQNSMSHDGMSKDSMSGGAMSKGDMTKNGMTKDTMTKDGMKADKTPKQGMATGSQDHMMSNDAMKK